MAPSRFPPLTRRLLAWWLTFAALVLNLLAPTLVAAQAVPDAGSLLRERERQDRVPTPPVPASEGSPLGVPAPAAAASSTAGAERSVRVERFRFDGATALTAAQLQASVAPWAGRRLGLRELGLAAEAVGQAYRREGLLAQVSVPPQEVTDGSVVLRIQEARLGRVVVQGDAADARVPAALVESTVRGAQRSGSLLRLDELEGGLLLAQDLPGVAVRGSLQAGSEPGGTDVHLRVEPERRWAAELGADNFGSRATGRARAEAQLAAHSPLGRGDLGRLLLSATSGSRYLRYAHTLPVLDARNVLGLTLSRLDYDLNAADLAATDGKGSASTIGVEARRVVRRAPDHALTTGLAFEHRLLDSEALGSTTSKQAVDAATLSVEGWRAWADGVATSGQVALTVGRVDMQGAPQAAALVAATTGTAGRYAKLRGAGRALWPLTPAWTASLSLEAQWASKNLDSSERMGITGPNGVRAYSPGEASGSAAVLASAEVRRALPRVLDKVDASVAAFVDVGQARPFVDTDFAGAPATRSVTLSGAGLALQARLPQGVQLAATWSRRLASNPNPNPLTGLDQSGDRGGNRFWLSARIAF